MLEADEIGRYGPILSLVASSKEGDALILDPTTKKRRRKRDRIPTLGPEGIAAFSLVTTFLSMLVLHRFQLDYKWSMVVGVCTLIVVFVVATLLEDPGPATLLTGISGSGMLLLIAFRMEDVHPEIPFMLAAVAGLALWFVCLSVSVRDDESGLGDRPILALYGDRIELVSGDPSKPMPLAKKLDPTDEVRTIEQKGIRTVFLTSREGAIRLRMADYVVKDRNLEPVSDDVAGEIRSRISRL